MSQSKKKEAWAVMTKLVPSASYVNTENDNQEEVENREVGQLELLHFSLNYSTYFILLFVCINLIMKNIEIKDYC